MPKILPAGARMKELYGRFQKTVDSRQRLFGLTIERNPVRDQTRKNARGN